MSPEMKWSHENGTHEERPRPCPPAPAGPLLIDGRHRLYKAAATGRAEIPAFVLTAADTLLIHSDTVLGPPRPARPGLPHRHPRHD